jgi:hypothetical protein
MIASSPMVQLKKAEGANAQQRCKMEVPLVMFIGVVAFTLQ